MTKQEKIRRETKAYFAESMDEYTDAGCLDAMTKNYLEYLASQGVVIKVEGEDAMVLVNVEDRDCHNEVYLPIRISNLDKAGYVAVEPLIKEE